MLFPFYCNNAQIKDNNQNITDYQPIIAKRAHCNISLQHPTQSINTIIISNFHNFLYTFCCSCVLISYDKISLPLFIDSFMIKYTDTIKIAIINQITNSYIISSIIHSTLQHYIITNQSSIFKIQPRSSFYINS